MLRKVVQLACCTAALTLGLLAAHSGPPNDDGNFKEDSGTSDSGGFREEDPSAGDISGNVEGGHTDGGNPTEAAWCEQCAPPDPEKGPGEAFVYRNQSRQGHKNEFKIGPKKSAGSAHYVWAGTHNKDKLKFLAKGTVTDKTGIGLPQPSDVEVWLYEASDGQNKWYLAFGVDPLPEIQGRERYPLY